MAAKLPGIVCGPPGTAYSAIMFDTVNPGPVPCASAPMQRSIGRAEVGFKRRDNLTKLGRLHQTGSARVILPMVAGPVPEVVFLNTSGGLTSGDRLDLTLNLGAGSQITATTQTAERAYAAPGGPAEVRIKARLGAGAWLHWLPQETILFERSHLRRETEIDMAGDAACLLCESVVLGRHAMGETVTSADLFDRRTLRRDGAPVWIDAVGFGVPALAAAGSSAMLGTARGFGVIALIARGAEDALAAVRRVLDEPAARAAASGWDGKCIVRVVARDGWALRRQMIRALQVLGAAPLPRVWQM